MHLLYSGAQLKVHQMLLALQDWQEGAVDLRWRYWLSLFQHLQVRYCHHD
jgi:hypothetical protein